MTIKIPLLARLPRKPRRLLLWFTGLVLAYTLLGFLVLPPIVRAVAVSQLSKQLGREVAIQKVKLNPYTLSATVRGLQIKDRDGTPFISWEEVYVNFQLVSFFGHPWVFKEVVTTKPFVRVQMNKDYTFNFSDLITKFSTNAPPAKPPKPLALRIDRFRIAGATAALTDLSPHKPFHRVLGPIDITLVHFRTAPDSKNPYSFMGTTDAGEKFAWSGYFCLNPLLSEGEISLENIALTQYAPLYQDLVRFEVKDGSVDLRSAYRFEVSASNRVAAVTNASFNLHSFKLAEPGTNSELLELDSLAVTGASADTQARQAEVSSITATGGRLAIRRGKDNAINVLEMSKPAEDLTNAPGGILLLLRAVTNAVSLLLQTTNAWTGSIRNVEVKDCALHLEDLSNSRAVRLDLDQIALSARQISNLPGSNVSASVSLRWNTNGAIKTEITASFVPTTADVHLSLDHLELRPLDPYLESKVDAFILGSKLSLEGNVHLRAAESALPEVTFSGDARLDDFSAVDGLQGEELMRWDSVRASGMEATLEPPAVTIREVAVDGAFVRAIIETNRTINLIAALRLADTNAPSAPPDAPKPSKNAKKKTVAAQPSTPLPAQRSSLAGLPKMSIGSIVISNAQVHFTDRSLSPNVNLMIQQAGGTIGALSSEQLRHAEVNLHARVDNVGPVEITGTINPFSSDQTNDIKIAVKNVDLVPTSPYVGKFAGYRLSEGRLAMDLSYHLTGRNLKSQNLITLDRFTFGEKVNSPDATKLPVRLAVAILKDRNGKIQLDVPIEGSLDDPEFRLHKVIVHALLNILTKVATSPFSLLGAVFGGKSEELGYQDFAPGSPEILPAGKAKLDGLVKALYDRPGLQLEIEGSVAPAADREGLKHRALEEKLRTRKWMSLRKSERATTTPAQITFAPEERARWLKELYADALSKGTLTAPVASNAPPTAGAGVNGTNATAAESISLSELFPSKSDKGATLLRGKMGPAQDVPGKPGAGETLPARASVVDVVEQALLDSIPVSEADLGALAAERAKAVREYLMQGGQVGPERVFLTQAQTGGVNSQGSRAYLHLQ